MWRPKKKIKIGPFVPPLGCQAVDRGGLSLATCSPFIFPRPGPAFWCAQGSGGEAVAMKAPSEALLWLHLCRSQWSREPLSSVPLGSLSCLLVDLFCLQSSPIRGLPCGHLQLSPSPAGFDHSLPCFLILRTCVTSPNPVAWTWGPMAGTAMCSWNLVPFPAAAMAT